VGGDLLEMRGLEVLSLWEGYIGCFLTGLAMFLVGDREAVLPMLLKVFIIIN